MANVSLLGYYKYTDFFIENVNFLTGGDMALKNIILPIGISFFTFQLIAYLVDSYRGKTEGYDILNYLLFITFFPQLIVGPIIHHHEVVPQFEDRGRKTINWNNVSIGLLLFSIGCAKKLLLADPLTENAQAFFGGIQSGAALQFYETWFYSIEYTVSYYFDLSGYADMAIGLGFFFNILIPANFNSPYKARNFQDYWRRWHMTLSRFLSDYIFRSVYRKDKKWRGYYVATMVTFLVSGFWHGAGWTFVAWGIMNGALVCIAAWMKRKDVKLPSLLAYPLTAVGVVVARVLFVSDSFEQAKSVYQGMFRLMGSTKLEQVKELVTGNKTICATLAIAICICWFAPNSGEISEKFKPNVKYAVLTAVLLAVSIMSMNKVATFLYFQF